MIKYLNINELGQLKIDHIKKCILGWSQGIYR